ncbi:gfo/Idh/MocA family oxidoreductase, partial [Rhizobium sp. GCM10022189]
SATWRDIAVPAVPTNYQRFAEAVRTGKQDDPTFRHAANLQKVLDLAMVTERDRRELEI